VPPVDTAAKRIIINMLFESVGLMPKILFNGQVADDSHESAIVKSRSDTRRSGRGAFGRPMPMLRFLDVFLARNYCAVKVTLAYIL